MGKLPIRTFPDPVLLLGAADVVDFDDGLKRLIDDMFETMYYAPGVGLAAPQIGISKRVFVADIGDGPFEMINPEIVHASGRWSYEEGCLSVPERYWKIGRSDYVRAEGFDAHGASVVFEGDELMGRVLQHEIDHLNGVLLLSHLGKVQRRRVLRELREGTPGTGRMN